VLRIHHFDTDPDPAFCFDDLDPTFHFDADPDADSDPTFQFDAITDPDPILPLTFPALAPLILQNNPLRLPPFHFDANPDPDPAIFFDADPDKTSRNDANPCEFGSATLLI
jgi:hypothetical protein